MERFEVRVQPDGLRVTVDRGTPLVEAVRAAGVPLATPCGGAGVCGKCAVQLSPSPEPTPSDLRHLDTGRIADGWRLACRQVVDRPLSVLVGDDLRRMEGHILVAGIARDYPLDPPLSRTCITLPDSLHGDGALDAGGFLTALGFPANSGELSADVVADIRGVSGNADRRVTVLREGKRLIAIESGDRSGSFYGMAFDIGTTTIVGLLMDLVAGRECAHASRLNPQVVYGEDTISRLKYAVEREGGREELAAAVRRALDEIIGEASVIAGVAREDICEITAVGNTVMTHLFMGLDPTGLAQLPFLPATTAPVSADAASMGISIHPRGMCWASPSIAGFVGGDTVGVILACGLMTPGTVRLAVDVGTNGELALRTRSGLTVCSTAAGPALEGAVLTCGMRAASGAIEHVTLADGGIDIEVIDGVPPIGICGSGIIDAVAVLLDAGVIESSGAFAADISGVAPGIRERLIERDGQPAFVLAGAGENAPRPVVLTQRDIRQIQLAKGAIRAGIELLCADAGLTTDDLGEVLLAGAFGNHLDPRSSRRIGLLPSVPDDRIRFVGNAAAAGARLALLSSEARKEMERIRAFTRHVELASLPGFTDAFTDAMLFPER